jgi:hypothetical protein
LQPWSRQHITEPIYLIVLARNFVYFVRFGWDELLCRARLGWMRRWWGRGNMALPEDDTTNCYLYLYYHTREDKQRRTVIWDVEWLDGLVSVAFDDKIARHPPLCADGW